MVDLVDDPDCPKAGRHRELEDAAIMKGEQAVQRVMIAVRNFTNPFTIPDKNRLYSLTFGAPIPTAAENDILQAEVVGNAAKAAFIGQLKNEGPGKFFDPIQKKQAADNGGIKQKTHPDIVSR